MNYKEHTCNFSVDPSEVEDILLAIFHTVVFHRTLPALDFKSGTVSYNSYIGIRNVDCRCLNLSYVCVNSLKLINKIANPIVAFVEDLKRDSNSPYASGESRGTVSLEFAVNRKASWFLNSEPSVWERWVIILKVATVKPEDLGQHRIQLEDELRQELLSIVERMNSESTSHIPSLGISQEASEHIIDFSIPDISPYQFQIKHTTTHANQHRSSMGVTALRLLKDGRF